MIATGPDDELVIDNGSSNADEPGPASQPLTKLMPEDAAAQELNVSSTVSASS